MGWWCPPCTLDPPPEGESIGKSGPDLPSAGGETLRSEGGPTRGPFGRGPRAPSDPYQTLLMVMAWAGSGRLAIQFRSATASRLGYRRGRRGSTRESVRRPQAHAASHRRRGHRKSGPPRYWNRGGRSLPALLVG